MAKLLFQDYRLNNTKDILDDVIKRISGLESKYDKVAVGFLLLKDFYDKFLYRLNKNAFEKDELLDEFLMFIDSIEEDLNKNFFFEYILKDFRTIDFKYTLDKILSLINENQFNLEDYEIYKKELISFIIGKLNYPLTISGLFIEVVLNEFMSKNDFIVLEKYKELYRFCYALDSVVGKKVLSDKIELRFSPLIKIIYLSNRFKNKIFKGCWKKTTSLNYKQNKHDIVEKFLDEIFDEFILEFKIYLENAFENSKIKGILKEISIKYNLNAKKNINELLKIITRKSRLLILKIHKDTLYKQMLILLEHIFDECFKEKEELFNKRKKLLYEQTKAKLENRQHDYMRLALEQDKIMIELRHRYDENYAELLDEIEHKLSFFKKKN